MAASHITDIIHEFLSDNEAWEALLVAAETVSDSRVKSVNDKLLSIRELTKVEDPFVAEQTLRMKGITLTDEILKLRGDSIFKSLHLLPSFSTLHGSPDYPKFIEFLLGRGVQVTRLYTVDYVNFHTEAGGLLVHEGGNWYLTSHVQLEVENMEELGEDAERIVHELFYRYAPIEEVIHQTFNMIRLIGRFYLASRVELMNKRYVNLLPEVVATELWVFPQIMSGEEYEVRVITTYADEAQVSEIPSKIEIDCDHTFVDGKLVVNTEEILTLPIRSEHKGIRNTKTVKLLPYGYTPVPDDVYVIAGTEHLYGNMSTNFTLMGVYGNHRRPLPDQTMVSWTHQNKKQCVLQVNELSLVEDVRMLSNDTVTARYVASNGQEFQDSIHLHLHPTQTGVYPVALEMNVLRRIFQGELERVSVFLKYSDGSRKEVSSNVESNTKAVVVSPSNILTSEIAYSDYSATLKASYKEDGYNFEVTKEVDLIYRIYELSGIEIIGKDSIKENSKSMYKALATWEGIVQSYVDVYWEVLRTVQGSNGSIIGVRSSIDQEGWLSTPEVVGDTVTIIQATLKDERGNIHKATKVVGVENTVRTLMRLELTTDKTSLSLNERTYVSIYGTWSDESTTLEEFDKYQVYVETSEETFIRVDEDERGVYLEYVEGNAETVTVFGRINHANSTVVTQPWFVSLVVPLIKLESIEANKIRYVEESTRVMFGARAGWEDGRYEEATAIWSFTQEDVDPEYYDFDWTQGNFSLRDLAFILTSESLTAEEMMDHPKLRKYDEFKDIKEADLDNVILNRVIFTSRWLEGVTQEAEVKVKCVYYKAVHEQTVTITRREQTAVDPILSATIHGPLEFHSDRAYTTYALNIKYDNECPAYNVSNDWSLDCDPEIAEIDENGYLIPRSNVDAWITITATINCGGRFLERTLRVHMLKYNSRLTALNIFGPSTLNDNTKYTFNAELSRSEDPSDSLDAGQIEFSIDTMADCHMNPLSGELHVGEMYEDHTAIISASYEEYDYEKEIQYDHISSEKHVVIKAQRKLLKVEIQVPENLSDSSGEYKLQVKGFRRDGSEEILDSITAPNASAVWRTTKNVQGIELREDGTLLFSNLAATASLPVECVVYEGQTIVKDVRDLLVTSESTPVELTIAGNATIRHLGKYQYRAIVERISGKIEDVTSKVYWKIEPEEKYIGMSNGELTLARAYELKDVKLVAILQEGEARLESHKIVNIRSTYPLYGAAQFGVNTPEEAFEALTQKIPSNISGNLTVFVEPKEYAYIFYPRDFGYATFTPIGVNDVTGWDGAKREYDDDDETGPREIEVVTEEGDREIWYLYRTNNKGFDFASFSVSFDSSQ